MPTPRRIFPGYTVAAVATLAVVATAPGQTFIVALLNTEPVREGLGISSLWFNNTYAAATVLAAFPLVITGRLTDRLGPRLMLAVVAFAFALGCLVMSQVQGLVSLFLGFFCLRFLGQGSLTLVANHSVAMWFHRRLGSVNGLKIVVISVLWAFLPQLTLRLMGSVGWRQTYMIFAAAVVVVIVPLALLLVRNAPEDLGLRTDNDPPDAPHGPRAGAKAPARPEPSFTLRQARRTGAFWILALTTMLPGFVGTAILFDMIPIVTEKGFDNTAAASTAANAVSAWLVTMGVLAIPAGVLTDRVRPSVLIVVSMIVAAVSIVAMVFATSPIHIAAAMVVYAVGMSLSSACASATIARFFGRLHHGAIRSSLTRLGIIGTGLGPVTTAVSYATTGSYRPALWAFAGFSIFAAGVAGLLRTPVAPTVAEP